MSDFLGNLAGRSMGLAETIQPRIPPVYEPHGHESGLISERPRSRAAAGEARSDAEAAEEADDEQAPVAKIRPSRLPPEPARLERRQDGDRRLARSAESVQLDRPRESPVPMAIRPDDVAKPMPPPGLPARNNKVFPASEIAPQVLKAFDTPDPQPTREVPVQGRFVAKEPLDAVAEEAESLRPSAPTMMHPTQPPVKVEIPARARRVVENASDHLDIPSVERTKVEPVTPREVSRPVEPAPSPARPNSIVQPLAPGEKPRAETEPGSYLAPGPASPARELQPPVTVRAGAPMPRAMPAPMPAPMPSAAEPPVRITIGRVEVRAVFPEPAVRRTPSPRSKPTLSLDDYLKQSNRGNR